jgi:hypothetical protein
MAVFLSLSGVAYAQELTAEQRSACMGDYESSVRASSRGRPDHCVSIEVERQAHSELQKVLTAAEKK